MGSSVIGFKYFMALHFGICHGPVDTLRRIFVGDREAWAGDQTTSGSITLNAPELFGGDEREGGIAGAAEVMMGESTQTLPSSVAAALPSPAPAFRGTLTLFYDGQITANNPYVKPFAFKLQRIFSGWASGSAWYPEKAAIGEITPGDAALTILQSRFIAGVADDESAYSRGAPVQDGGTVIDGAFVVNRDNGTQQFTPSVLTWEGFSPNGTDALTVEAIVRWEATPNVASTSLLEVKLNTADSSTVYSFLWYLASGHLQVKHAFDEYITPGPVTDDVHIAMVFTADEVRAYIDGALVKVFPGTGVPDTPMRVRVGDWAGYSLDTTRYTVFGFRVRNEEVYTGSSFSPPTEIPDPDGSSASTGALLMNPAHIIYQCHTDPQWGMGYPTATIGPTFTAAADQLWAEDFGLCMLWNRQEEIGAFVRRVLDHIGAVLYTNPQTGAFELKLIRDDYDPETLDVFDESNVIAVESFQRVGYGDMVNEITVVYRDVETNRDTPVTVQNLAAVQAQGGVVSQTRQYPGIPNADLALRVAQRDLLAASTPLAKARVRVNRTAWSRFPGDVFRLVWPKLGITSIVVRVLGIDFGSLDDGSIVLDVAEDVFGLPASSYAAQEPRGWVEPQILPSVITAQDVVEAPYRSLVNELSAAELAAIDEDAAYLSALAARPSASSTSFDIFTRVGTAAFSERAVGSFVPYAELDIDIGHTDTAIPLAAGVDLSIVSVGTLAIIGSGRDGAEWVRVDAINPAAPSMTISRGMLDTTPRPHAAGDPVWFDDASSAPELVERATGETVDFRLLTKTVSGRLPIASAITVSGTAQRRQDRPYPPGKVRINGEAYPVSAEDALEITWAHRDRLQQTAGLIDQATGNIGPESGVTYSAELRNVDADSLVASASGLTGTSWTPQISQAGSYDMRLQLWAVRDGVDSWQRHDYTFAYSGAGLSIGAPSATLSAVASLVFPPSGIVVTMETTQSALAARAASGWRSKCTLVTYSGGFGQVVSAGAVLTLFFTRYYEVDGQLYGESTTISFGVPSPLPHDSALAGLRTLILASPTLSAAGWNASVVTSVNGSFPPYLEIFGPVGGSWYVDAVPAYTEPISARWGLVQTIYDAGGPEIPADIPQIVEATLSGTVAPGDRVTITLNGTPFAYSASTTDTLTSIATVLAALINGSASYDAASVDEVITITGVGSLSFNYVAATEGAHAYGNFDPLAPDPYWSQVELLLHGDGTDGAAGFVDSGPDGRTVTAIGSAQHDDAHKVFGPTSIYIPGTTSRLEIPNGSHFYFDGDFTVEARVRFSSVASFQHILQQGGDSNAWWLRITNTAQLAFGGIGGSDEVTSGATTIAANAWTAVAMARQGTTLRLFINGVVVSTLTKAAAVGNASPTTPFMVSDTSFALNGAHVDEVRITKGVARYTANYTPHPVAFVNY